MKSLRDQRIERGITQKVLAELTGINQSYLSNVERGIRRPNEETRDKIEKALGKVDFIETAGIKLKVSSYYKAERYINKVVEMLYLMNSEEKTEITNLIKKYFK